MESPVIVSRRIAVLVDGDNTQPSLIEGILTETTKYGLVAVRRVYGDWTEPSMKGWKDALNRLAIQPIQQFRYTVGKNATDSALIIDAMDILYEGVVEGICLVSSDSDYTRLATRIREKGLFVMGIGRKTTPRPFVNACEVFVYTENIAAEAEASRTTRGVRKASPSSQAPSEEAPSDALPILKTAIETAMGDSDWANLGAVGNILRQNDPSFDPRSYGYRQLLQLVRAYPDSFEIRQERSRGSSRLVYVRLKD